ncbi:NAD kinase [Halalkalibacter sp. APA_J-10(15)]|uniref:NAD kinase n=1 Tax=unclassified Halalkalibacter TaxID=2893063 RepID=UPI001FF55BDA|nr:NAD kinase [Halalkalibacter sp. APA_J-10(15)]MCK0472608.1 NAD kinase [Halalkalibacter sp. APA_J-10(15)]
MNFAVTSRGDDLSNDLQKRIKEQLMKHGLVYNQHEPELVITVGGDGTLLQAFHDYAKRLEETAFVGIHTGHLGFYADWVPSEVEQLINDIVHKPFQVVEYPLLEVVIHHNQDEGERHLALNESTIKGLGGSIVSNVEIKGDTFEVFRGDGLCISTPSGSTAYNKALGGAILHPSLASIQISEMASINNRVYRTIGSPLVLPKHHVCLLRPLNEVEVQVTIDHYTLEYRHIYSLQCRVADERIRFARYRSFPFWKRVKESFIRE